MTSGVGDRGDLPRRRRPGRAASSAAALLLLLGGGAAVASGVLGQDADPPAPAVATVAEQPPTPPPGPAPAPADPALAEPAAPVAAPVSLRIPAIDVDSPLLHLGLNPDGTLAVPQPGPDYDLAAWYDGSPRPGAVGPAVIEGHVDSAANGPSVFYRLGALVPGDRVEVNREDGTTAAFAVDEVRVVPKDDFPTLGVYGNTEGPELRLITCGGPFDGAAGQYVDNTVVFATQVAP